MQLWQFSLSQMVIFVTLSFLSETKTHIAFITEGSGCTDFAELFSGGGRVAVRDGRLLCACQRMRLVATFAWMLFYFHVFGAPRCLQSWWWSNHALTRPNIIDCMNQ